MKEKRKVSRVQILDSFSVYIVVDECGPFRLRVSDLSEIGIGFQMDAEFLSHSKKMEAGSEVRGQLYLNQSLYLPLVLKVIRVSQNKESTTIVGAEFIDKNKKVMEALKNFTAVLSCLEGVAELNTKE